MTQETYNKIVELTHQLGPEIQKEILSGIKVPIEPEKKEFWLIHLCSQFPSLASGQFIVCTSQQGARHISNGLSGLGRKVYHVKEV